MYDNITHQLLHQKVDNSFIRNETEAEIIKKIEDAVAKKRLEEDLIKSVNKVSEDPWRDYLIPFESDPNGLDQYLPGAKVDAGKVRMSLVLDGFKRALTEVGKVGTFGANKYSDNGWMEVENGIARYRDAMYRHLFATDYYDNQSGFSHMAHAAWNMLAMLELMEREESSPLTKVKENGD